MTTQNYLKINVIAEVNVITYFKRDTKHNSFKRPARARWETRQHVVQTQLKLQQLHKS